MQNVENLPRAKVLNIARLDFEFVSDFGF